MRCISNQDLADLLALVRSIDSPGLYSPLREYNIRRRAILIYRKFKKNGITE